MFGSALIVRLLGVARTLRLAPVLGICLALSAAGSAQGRPAPSGSIALTFDDLPALSLIDDQAYVTKLNRDLLARLQRHHFPATGFVNEGKLDELDRTRQIGVLKAWLRAGMDLGNHTFSHEPPNDIGAEAYIADIEKGEPVTRGLLSGYGRTLRWFRHPYLQTGFPAEQQERINRWLADHHYRVAPVTMENSDWMFSEPYDDAIARHDSAAKARIAKEYLDYSGRMIAWHQAASHALFGRDIAFVMLLHATRLNADSLDALARMIRHDRLKVVSLDTAMQDPAYRTPDTYAARDGVNWLERWAQTLHKELPWDDYVDPPKDIQTDYDRVDKDRN